MELFAATTGECSVYDLALVKRPPGAGVVEGGLVDELVRLHSKHRQ